MYATTTLTLAKIQSFVGPKPLASESPPCHSLKRAEPAKTSENPELLAAAQER